MDPNFIETTFSSLSEEQRLFSIKVRLSSRNENSALVFNSKPLSKLLLIQEDEEGYIAKQARKFRIQHMRNDTLNPPTQYDSLFFIIIFGDIAEFNNIIENFPMNDSWLIGHDSKDCKLWLSDNNRKFINSVESLIFPDAPKPAKRS
jgi:hypothetical protein